MNDPIAAIALRADMIGQTAGERRRVMRDALKDERERLANERLAAKAAHALRLDEIADGETAELARIDAEAAGAKEAFDRACAAHDDATARLSRQRDEAVAAAKRSRGAANRAFGAAMADIDGFSGEIDAALAAGAKAVGSPLDDVAAFDEAE